MNPLLYAHNATIHKYYGCLDKFYMPTKNIEIYHLMT